MLIFRYPSILQLKFVNRAEVSGKVIKGTIYEDSGTEPVLRKINFIGLPVL